MTSQLELWEERHRIFTQNVDAEVQSQIEILDALLSNPPKLSPRTLELIIDELATLRDGYTHSKDDPLYGLMMRAMTCDMELIQVYLRNDEDHTELRETLQEVWLSEILETYGEYLGDAWNSVPDASKAKLLTPEMRVETMTTFWEVISKQEAAYQERKDDDKKQDDNPLKSLWEAISQVELQTFRDRGVIKADLRAYSVEKASIRSEEIKQALKRKKKEDWTCIFNWIIKDEEEVGSITETHPDFKCLKGPILEAISRFRDKYFQNVTNVYVADEGVHHDCFTVLPQYNTWDNRSVNLVDRAKTARKEHGTSPTEIPDDLSHSSDDPWVFVTLDAEQAQKLEELEAAERDYRAQKVNLEKEKRVIEAEVQKRKNELAEARAFLETWESAMVDVTSF